MKNQQYRYPMEVRCAWCDTHMCWKSCHKPDKISHGICESCKKEIIKEIKEIRPAGTACGA